MSSDPNKNIKIVFTCLDWRLHPQVENFFASGGDGCDMCVTAGSIKGLIDPATRDYFIEQINISKKLHNCRKVILTMHMDCGAYGGTAAFSGAEAEIANCKEQLKQAKDIIKQKFPELPSETYIIGLEKREGDWAISPEEIKL